MCERQIGIDAAQPEDTELLKYESDDKKQTNKEPNMKTLKCFKVCVVSTASYKDKVRNQQCYKSNQTSVRHTTRTTHSWRKH